METPPIIARRKEKMELFEKSVGKHFALKVGRNNLVDIIVESIN